MKKWVFTIPLQVLGTLLSFVVLSIFTLISPFVIIKVGGLIAQRIGHLAWNTDLFFRKRQFYGWPKRTRYIFIAGSIANRQLLTMWKRHMCIIESRLLRGLFEYSNWLWKRTPFFQPIDTFTTDYEELFIKGQPTLSFTPEENQRGNDFLRKMGINPENDWFVCLSCRDDAYLNKTVARKWFGKKDWSYHDYRNSDINDFRLAVDYIVQEGGYVIRMGRHTSRTLDIHHKKVIDYAQKFRTDFMDIFLMAKCRFFLGTDAGICEVATIFDVPRVLVNIFPPPMVGGKNQIYLPQKVRLSGQYVCFDKIIHETRNIHVGAFAWNGHRARELGYRYEHNTPEEILEITKEMMARLEGKFILDPEAEKLMEKLFSLFPKGHRSAKNRTPVGLEFLRKNEELFFSKAT